MTALPQIDETLGKYRIISILGKGTTATVYKASHKFLNVDVALKVLSPKLILEDSTIRDRFLEEAMNHAKLSHNNFVRIIDVEHEEKYTYIVMEFVDGADLDNILKLKGPLPPLQVIRIILEVCKALKYALDLNIIHRDIKPGNIIITKNSEVKLADFGLAKSIGEPDKHQKNSGMIFGTPYYMPPEQFIDSARVDHRSDLYSLGATIYHLVTGKLPFETESLPEIISMQINKSPVPPLHISSEISEEFSMIIMKLLAKSPLDRYQNYLELIRDLEKAEQSYKAASVVIEKPDENLDLDFDTSLLKKYDRYQKYFRKFNEEKTISTDLVSELEQIEPGSPDEQKLKEKILEKLKEKANFNSVKPDIESYVSQNVKEYLNNLDKNNPEEDDEVSDRLQQKYQKYFKKFHQGADLEMVVINNLNPATRKQTTLSPQNSEIPIDLPENLKRKQPAKPAINLDSLNPNLSKDFKQSYEKFNEKNHVKINASGYIQKFKKLFEKS